MPKDPLGLYDEVIVIPFEIPWSVGVGKALEPDGQQPVQRDAGSTARIVAPLDARAAAESFGWPPPESRLIGVDVRDCPTLAVSGASDGELTLWRRRTDIAPAVPLATFMLHPDGSQLFVGDKFIGLLYEKEGATRLHPDWLRSIGAVASAGFSDEASTTGAGGSANEHNAAADKEPPYDPPIRPVYPIEELIGLALAGGVPGRSAWRILRWTLAAVARRIARRSISSLAESGKELDPSDTGRQLTRAGRGLQKHGGRTGSSFPAPKGNPAELNRRGQEVLEKMLNGPASIRRNNRFRGIDVIAPNGQGARFDSGGHFMGFLEP